MYTSPTSLVWRARGHFLHLLGKMNSYNYYDSAILLLYFLHPGIVVALYTPPEDHTHQPYPMYVLLNRCSSLAVDCRVDVVRA